MRSAFLVLLATLLCAAPGVHAADRGSGHFRKGEVRTDLKHAVAVMDEDAMDGGGATYVYLSDVPFDAKAIASAFHASTAAEQQLGDGSAGYVRICINAEGGECGLYFSHNKPNASFNTSGYGAFKLAQAPAGRVAGRWVLAGSMSVFGGLAGRGFPVVLSLLHEGRAAASALTPQQVAQRLAALWESLA